MKRIFLTIISIYLSFALCAQQPGIIITSGSHIVADDGSTIVIQNGSLINNGEFRAFDNTVVITGSALTSQSVLGGVNTIYFDELELNKTSNDLQLETDIEMFSKLKMTSGNVQLNNQNIILSDPSAIIEGETETNRIIGTTGGEIIIYTNLNHPVTSNPGNLGAEISAPGDLGVVEIRRGHVQQTTPDGGISIQRYYDILPANNSNLDATLRFHYFDAESAGVPEGEFELYRFTGGSWQPQYVGVGPSDRDPSGNWLQKTGIPAFSRWTVGSSITNPLPVELLYFTSACKGEFTQLHWATASETQSAFFTIEWSQDGINWSELTQIEASGNSGELTNYSFVHERRIEGSSYYRLYETGFDADRVMLETVASDCYKGGNADLTIYPNPVLSGNGIYLNFNGNQTMPEMKVELFNAIGQLVWSQSLNVKENDLIALPLPPQLAAGHYFLHLKANNNGYYKISKLEVISN